VGCATLLAISSCATSPTQEIPESPDNSLLIGRVDVDTSVAPFPTDLLEIQFKQVSPATDAPYRQATVDSGYFYFEAVPGTYKLANLKYGFLWPRGDITYLDGARSVMDFQVGPAAVQSLGAYKLVHNTVTNMVEIVPKERLDFAPSEQEMLSWLLKHIKDRKRWETVIMKRLNQVGGPVSVY
jgi:hypothetical protein